MSSYNELANVTRIMLERDLDRHRSNVNLSKQIAGELAQIDAMRAAAQSDSGAINARQMLGADVLWQGWLLRKRADIQRRAAKARAQELETLDIARLAFARSQATEALVQKDRQEKLRKQLLAEAETIDTLGHLRRALRSEEE